MILSLGKCGDADCMLELEHDGLRATFLIEGIGWRILEELQIQADNNPSHPKYPVALVYRPGGLLFDMLHKPEDFEGRRI